MRIKVLFVIMILLVSVAIAFGQSSDQKRLSIVFRNVTLIQAMEQIEEETDLVFAYDSQSLKDGQMINVRFDDHSLSDVLDFIFSSVDIDYKIIQDQIILTKTEKPSLFSINGYVQDNVTGEKLAYATIYFSEIDEGVTANDDGYYSIQVPAGIYRVYIGYVGRDELVLPINVNKDTIRIFELSHGQSLDPVVITPDAVPGGTSLHRIYQRQAIQDRALETPAVGGESDALQIVRNQAGVESGAGGVGSLFVRGGEDDQNLILMDGVPIYYPSHLLGIYSIFNAESVRNIEVYKGGFPARYGGKLSSVIDIQTKNGRTDGWHADLSGSYQSVRGVTQGPLFKGANIMLGGRQSISAPFVNDVLAQSFFDVDRNDLASDYKDFNLKINFQIGKKGKIVLSGYSGTDILSVEVEDSDNDILEAFSSNLNWSNNTLSLAYHRELGQRSFLKLSQTYNSFLNEYEELLEFEEEDEIDEVGAYQYVGTYSNNNDITTKINIDQFVSPKIINRYGASYSRHEFTASTDNLFESEFGEIDSTELDINYFQRSEKIYESVSTVLYFEQERKLSSKLLVNLGLRWSGFQSDEEFYNHLEPRLSMKYLMDKNLTLDLSLSKMVQYIHQVSDANLSFPKDVWLPANDVFRPSIAWQIGAGLKKTYPSDVKLDIQTYYKDLQNLNLVEDIYDLTELLKSDGGGVIGAGRSIGLELSTEVPLNNLLLENALTFAKTTRRFDLINDDRPHPFQYDRRIVFKSSATLRLSDKLTLGSRVYLGTATPEYFVDPVGGEMFAFFNLTPTNPENNQRAEPHFRIDISATYNLVGGKLNHRFKLNLYNIMNVQNSGFSYKDPETPNSTRYDVFALPFIPSLQYNISF